MRVPAKMTAKAGLLWLIALLVAGALAYWDFQSSATPGAEAAASSDSTGSADSNVDVEIVSE